MQKAFLYTSFDTICDPSDVVVTPNFLITQPKQRFPGANSELGTTIQYARIYTDRRAPLGRPVKTFHKFRDENVHAISVDESQKLLIAITSMGQVRWRLHMFNFPTGESPHPQASKAYFDLPFKASSVDLQINGDLVGVLHQERPENFTQDLDIYEWKTGASRGFLRCDPNSLMFQSFTFLSSDTIAVPCMRTHSIKVFTVASPRGAYNNPTHLRQDLMLGLPPIDPGCLYHFECTSISPDSLRNPLDSDIVLFSLAIGRKPFWPCHIGLIVHRKTLLELRSEACRIREYRPTQPTDWRAWGTYLAVLLDMTAMRNWGSGGDSCFAVSRGDSEKSYTLSVFKFPSPPSVRSPSGGASRLVPFMPRMTGYTAETAPVFSGDVYLTEIPREITVMERHSEFYTYANVQGSRDKLICYNNDDQKIVVYMFFKA